MTAKCEGSPHLTHWTECLEDGQGEEPATALARWSSREGRVKQGGSGQTGGNASARLDLKSPPSLLPYLRDASHLSSVPPDGRSQRVMAFREGWEYPSKMKVQNIILYLPVSESSPHILLLPGSPVSSTRLWAVCVSYLPCNHLYL